ncbi:unnamed protein product [Rhizophagus irregularis]|nr:unnamed protein product [Rhizophagus irregularis]
MYTNNKNSRNGTKSVSYPGYCGPRYTVVVCGSSANFLAKIFKENKMSTSADNDIDKKVSDLEEEVRNKLGPINLITWLLIGI